MNSMLNPFEYEAANILKTEEIIDYYIEDYNFSRFLQSTKNVFLIGERGSGKTMSLLYNSFKIQHELNKRNGCVSYDKIGVHISCGTPLFFKKEYLLIYDEYKKAILCEHYLVLSILYAIADTLSNVEEIVKASQKIEDSLYEECEYIWDVQLRRTSNFFNALKSFINRESVHTQLIVNDFNSNSFYERAWSFSSSVLPFLHLLKMIEELNNTHYILMIDDAHDMNEYQIRTLNSWIAYRDHSLYSFKVATTKVGRPEFITSTGGSILEGHDFLTVDMEQAYQNEDTDFFNLSKQIIEKRLKCAGIDVSPETFFPTNEKYIEDIKKCKETARKEGIEKYGDNRDAVNSYVTKYARAIYFRDRKVNANRPPYSGFKTIVDLSTGIVRNLLVPCYWMYDGALNSQKENIGFIAPSLQTNIIVDRSKRMWEDLKKGLDKVVDNCSSEDAKHISQLFEHVIKLFANRLMADISEPRAVVFSISQSDSYTSQYEELIRLLNIAQRAQYLYTRIGNAKSKAKQEIYYVPNRMLFPAVGLDPHGQYARVSLKVKDLYKAAFENIQIPFDNKKEFKQLDLFPSYEE